MDTGKGTLKFKLSESRGKLGEDVSAIINAVPDAWSWVDGWLSAPREMLVSQRASSITALKLSRFNRTLASFEGIRTGPGEYSNPDLFGVLAERRYPGQVSLEFAGYAGGAYGMILVKRILAVYVRLGYTGSLYFRSGDYRNTATDNPARCDLFFGIQPGQLPYVNLEWNGAYGGSMAHLAALEAVCRSQRLELYHRESALMPTVISTTQSNLS